MKYRTAILRGLALAAFIGITGLAFVYRDRIANLEAYGYTGIFMAALLSNATIFIPAPGVAVVFTMSGVFNPFWVALAACTGGAIGEISGYLAGYSGQAVVERSDIYDKIAPYVKKYSVVSIIVLAMIPNPFFDLAGIAAGALKMPFWLFFVSVWIGSFIKMLAIAYLGSASINWLTGIN